MTIQAPGNDSTFGNPPTYTLYISARRSFSTERLDFLSQSPVAVLDRFVGNRYAHDAPRWTQRLQSSIIFKYQATSFAKLFLRIANTQANLDVVSLFP
jgi:hypothetical protein